VVVTVKMRIAIKRPVVQILHRKDANIMILENSHFEAMAERALSFAKITVPGKDHKERFDYVLNLLKQIFAYLDVFNALGEYAVQVFDIPLTDIPVLKEFSDFVIPKSVKIDAADLDCVEMLEAPTLKISKSMSYADYLNTLMDFRSLFKSDLTNDVVKLADLRKVVSWSEIRNVAAYEFEAEGKKEYFTHQQDVPFVPVKLSPIMSGTMKERFFNITLTEELDDYLEKWLI
jgi:hypothetical protein